MTAARPRALAGVVLLLLLLVYPAVVYFALDRVGPTPLALVFVGALGLRLVLVRLKRFVWLAVFLLVATCFLLAIFTTNSPVLLKFYPVVVNAAFLVMFAVSLFYPPSMIERFASMAGMSMTHQGRVYTRGVTAVWCAFFVVNGAVIGWLATSGDDRLWALYTGLYSYIAMGTLFAVEYIYRGFYQRRVRGRNQRSAV